jgi:hypothetical protein
MNRQEFLDNGSVTTVEYITAKAICDKAKFERSIIGSYVIHHLMDTEEQRKYNNKHYERWGIDENGEFIEGKYVAFLTRSEHASYHMKHNNPMFNPNSRKKVSDSKKGVKLSQEHCDHLSEAHKGNPRLGWTEDTLRQVSESNKRTWSDPQLRKQLSDARKGSNNPMYGKMPGNSCKVIQKDKAGDTIRVFNSMKEAAKVLNVSIYMIKNICEGSKSQLDDCILSFG